VKLNCQVEMKVNIENENLKFLQLNEDEGKRLKKSEERKSVMEVDDKMCCSIVVVREEKIDGNERQ